MTAPNNQPAPEGLLRLSSKWLETNPLPEDGLLLEADDTWKPSSQRGRITATPGFDYATARTDLPREAYADSEPGDEVASERAEEKCPYCGDDPVDCLACIERDRRQANETIATLRAQLDAKDAECQAWDRLMLWLMGAPDFNDSKREGDNANRVRLFIDKLRAEVEELKAQVERKSDAALGYAQENTRLTAELDAKNRRIKELGTDLAGYKTELDAVRKERDAEVHQTEAFIRALGHGWSGTKTIEDRQEFLKAIHQSYLRWIEWKDAAQARCGELERAGKELIAAQDDFDTAIGKRENELENGFKTERVNLELRAARTRLTKARSLLTPSQQPYNLKGGDEPCAPQAINCNAPVVGRDQVQMITTQQDALSTGASNSPADVPSEGWGEWLSIETAPKDREILVLFSDGTIYAASWEVVDYTPADNPVFAWEPIGECFDEHNSGPTHWMHKPAPPIPSGVGQPDNFDSSSTEGRAAEGQTRPDTNLLQPSPRETQVSENQAPPAVTPSRPEPVKAGEWLPMETAPKRKVLLRIQTSPDAFRTVEALWINGQWDFDGMLFFKPVGWKPIAPEGKATEGEG